MSTDELDNDNTCPTAENRQQIQQALDQLMTTQGPAGALGQNRMDVVLTGDPAWKEGDIGELRCAFTAMRSPPAFSRR